MDFSSFLTSLGTSFVIFFILMCLFMWLSRRPGNHVIYYPNRILRGMDPYEGMRVSRNPFAWIREALASTEADVINMSGVDTAVYFVFLSTDQAAAAHGPSLSFPYRRRELFFRVAASASSLVAPAAAPCYRRCVSVLGLRSASTSQPRPRAPT